MTKILAIETSCDETSVAIVKNGTTILSNAISTQIEFHKKYGGIVPEIASRKHIEVINPLIQEALDSAKCKLQDIDAVAGTYGPGLIGSLLVGLCAAKALAFALDKPFIGVNHLEGHIYANFISAQVTSHKSQVPHFPIICLIVSGGHTSLVLVQDHGKYEILGSTRDDAAGEAFDKVARFLGLGYPGGPIIDKMAKKGNPNAIPFPRSMLSKEHEYDFSFSGLKTAVVNYVSRNPIRAAGPGSEQQLTDIAASFQQAIIDVLVEKSIRAAKDKGIKSIALAGGVSANSCLRENLAKKAKQENIEVIIPPIDLCTDNAAMIASAAYYKFQRGEFSNLSLNPIANLKLHAI